MIGVVIISAFFAAAAAVTALLMGSGWWMALTVYSCGGAFVLVALALVVARREDNDCPSQDAKSVSVTPTNIAIANAETSVKSHADSTG
ncbi:hypothetical protein [uncultured Tateyamaria sp.]|uniref:hypothetical protein n=1 Tax=uncultured Tateyamaria sp. TaxID=455651 RepID=UPI00260CE80A|nr:hypothetical protein [uncultured Tateyamaria sp.]